MSDLNTVTFDANQYQLVPKVPTDAMLDAAACASMQHLIDCVRDPEKLNEIGSEENVRKTHASRYHSMLAAAPTPAAQSAGQEALFWYRPCADGLYEGPHHANSKLGMMLRAEKPEAWKPLFTEQQTAGVAHAPDSDGWEWVRVKNLQPLLDALARAEEKGYMPDAFIAEWAALEIARAAPVNASEPVAHILTRKDDGQRFLVFADKMTNWRKYPDDFDVSDLYAAPVNGGVDDTYDQDGETLSLASLPPLREELAGGTFRGITTRKDGTHCAVILLPNKATEQRNWQACVDWAREAGGELPTRPVFHLLRLSATKEELAEGRWYYTADLLSDDTGNADDAAYAWYCDLNYGFTNLLHKSYEGLAVAVRLIPLTSTAKEQK